MFSTFSSMNNIFCKGSNAPTATLSLLTSQTMTNHGYLTGIVSNNGQIICYTFAGGGNNVYYSSNGGSTWSVSSGITTSNDFCIMSSDSTGQYILLCTSTSGTKPMYSQNYGASFSQLSNSATNTNGYWGSFVGEISGSYPSVLCWGCQTALYTSTDNGSTVSSNKIGSFKIVSMAGSGNYIVASQDSNSNTNNVVVSSNSGSTFSLFSPQITASPTFYGRDCAIGYDGTNLHILYSGISTNSTYLYNGSSWSLLSGSYLNTGDDFASGVDMSDSGKLQTIIDKTNYRCYYSTDYGATWSNITTINSSYSTSQCYGAMCSSNGQYAIIGQFNSYQLILLTLPTNN